MGRHRPWRTLLPRDGVGIRPDAGVGDDGRPKRARIDNVDNKVADTSIEKLKTEMNAPVPADLTFKVENFSAAVTDALTMQKTEFGPLTASFESSPYKLPDANTISADTPKVTALPQLPAAEPLAVVYGRSQVLKSEPAAAGAAPAPAAPVDLDWSTSFWKISLTKLNAEWTKSFGPRNRADPGRSTPRLNS